MSNYAGMSVTPAIYTDAEGHEHLDYNHAHVFDHSIRLNAQAEALGHQQNYFSKDVEGNVDHEWSLEQEGTEDFVSYIHGENDEYFSDDDDDEYDDGVGLTEEFVDQIYETLISESDYDYLVDWASENLSDDLCDQFDDIIDSGDEEDIYNAIERLIELYQKYA